MGYTFSFEYENRATGRLKIDWLIVFWVRDLTVPMHLGLNWPLEPHVNQKSLEAPLKFQMAPKSREPCSFNKAPGGWRTELVNSNLSHAMKKFGETRCTFRGTYSVSRSSLYNHWISQVGPSIRPDAAEKRGQMLLDSDFSNPWSSSPLPSHCRGWAIPGISKELVVICYEVCPPAKLRQTARYIRM